MPTRPRRRRACWDDGSIDLSFGGAADRGRVRRLGQPGAAMPAAPNCVALIRAEERFGNGDHVFDLAEQRRASDALYNTVRGTPQLHRQPPPDAAGYSK